MLLHGHLRIVQLAQTKLLECTVREHAWEEKVQQTVREHAWEERGTADCKGACMGREVQQTSLHGKRGTADQPAWEERYSRPIFSIFNIVERPLHKFFSFCYRVQQHFLGWDAEDGPRLCPKTAPFHPLVVFYLVNALRQFRL